MGCGASTAAIPQGIETDVANPAYPSLLDDSTINVIRESKRESKRDSKKESKGIIDASTSESEAQGRPRLSQFSASFVPKSERDENNAATRLQAQERRRKL